MNGLNRTENPNYNRPYDGIDLLPGIPVIITQQEAAYICNVSAQTIQRMIERKILPTNIDDEILKTDLIQYITTHTLADLPIL